DQPLHVRYVKWLQATLQGDFGFSFATRTSVNTLIVQRLPNTLAVLGVAYVISVLLAIPIGILSAVKRYSFFDHVATTFAFVGFSLPTFFTGLLLIIIFAVKLRWFPFIYDSRLVVDDLASLGQQLRQSIMPITVLTLFQTATLVRYVRAEMLENLPQDYVRTARAKGVREGRVVGGHVLRNSMIPVVTLIALGVPTIFTGAIITETIFAVPGIGHLLISSILNSDTPVVLAITFIFAVLVVSFNLVADVLYGVLDPRIRYA
ncbi:MAG: ABC transporter permease, partial [Thermoleophilaceae bacterium]